MNKQQEQANNILRCLKQLNRAVPIRDVERHLNVDIHKKTLLRRLTSLAESGQVIATGQKKSRTYRLVEGLELSNAPTQATKTEQFRFSPAITKKLATLDTHFSQRTQTSYKIKLVQQYIPNKNKYLPSSIKEHLHSIGLRYNKSLPASTYASQVKSRLLVDWTFNNCRLEDNTYSMQDVVTLLKQPQSAQSKDHAETSMVLNAKEALEFTIDNAKDSTPSVTALKNLHFILSQDLLANPKACGQERDSALRLDQSSYTPLDCGHQVKKYLALTLHNAAQIQDPFEQSLFLLAHLSYLQAFENLNESLARLACNIPLIYHNLCPITFVDVPKHELQRALIYFYEYNAMAPLIELYVWAYQRSSQKYPILRESYAGLNEFRISQRENKKQAIRYLIRNNLQGDHKSKFIDKFCEQNQILERDRFAQMISEDLTLLNEQAIHMLGVSQQEYSTWQNCA